MNPIEHSGRSSPFGNAGTDSGVDFSLFSRNASGMESNL